MSITILVKETQEPSRVLAIHHVNDEKDLGVTQIVFNRQPLVVGKRAAEVPGGDAQIKCVLPINLALPIPQRREQTGTDVENRYLHRVFVTNSLCISRLCLTNPNLCRF